MAKGFFEIRGTVKEFVDKYGEKEAQKQIDSFKKPRFKPESNLEKELERRAKDAKPK